MPSSVDFANKRLFKPLPAITGITQADPGVVACAGHGLVIGDDVYFFGLTEMTELNGTIKEVSAVGDVDHFSINDCSGYGSAETTGGVCGEKIISVFEACEV